MNMRTHTSIKVEKRHIMPTRVLMAKPSHPNNARSQPPGPSKVAGRECRNVIKGEDKTFRTATRLPAFTHRGRAMWMKINSSGVDGAWRSKSALVYGVSFHFTFHRNVLNGEAQDDGPNHTQRHLQVAINDFCTKQNQSEIKHEQCIGHGGYNNH